VTGKPVGEDLREGKPTVLYALARRRARGAAARVLDRYGASDLTEEEVGAVQDVLIDTGAVEEVELAIDGLVRQATRSLDAAPLAPVARTALTDLAYYVARRDR
jgi:geranylgeranyl diphosphate synthase type I